MGEGCDVLYINVHNVPQWGISCSVVSLTLQVVVVGVLSHPPVDEGPGEIVHSVLFVLNGFGYNLCIEVVV